MALKGVPTRVHQFVVVAAATIHHSRPSDRVHHLPVVLVVRIAMTQAVRELKLYILRELISLRRLRHLDIAVLPTVVSSAGLDHADQRVHHDVGILDQQPRALRT